MSAFKTNAVILQILYSISLFIYQVKAQHTTFKYKRISETSLFIFIHYYFLI